MECFSAIVISQDLSFEWMWTQIVVVRPTLYPETTPILTAQISPLKSFPMDCMTQEGKVKYFTDFPF